MEENRFMDVSGLAEYIHMATFHLELDKRVKLRNDKYNLCVRLGMGNDNMYLKIGPISESDYHKIFIKKAIDQKSVEFRKKCNTFLSRCETMFSPTKPFDKKKYRKMISGDSFEPEVLKETLALQDLLTRYLESELIMKLNTKDQYRTAINRFDNYQPGISILDITPSFLMKFEKDLIEEELSPFTISCYMRHLRSLINHFIYADKLVPQDYKYPFGRYGGYIIRKGLKQKIVMSNAEINKVIELHDFQTVEQEYARDIWVLSYWCNGMNYTDLFRLKWTNIHDDLITFSRMKTENTMRNYARDIVVPVLPRLKDLIKKVGIDNSIYTLGNLIKGADEATFRNKKDWQLEKIRAGLIYISEKLQPSVPLRLKTARDCYSETLRRAGYPDDIKDEMMGHSPVNKMAAHYNGIIDKERLFKINSCLIGISC